MFETESRPDDDRCKYHPADLIVYRESETPKAGVVAFVEVKARAPQFERFESWDLDAAKVEELFHLANRHGVPAFAVSVFGDRKHWHRLEALDWYPKERREVRRKDGSRGEKVFAVIDRGRYRGFVEVWNLAFREGSRC